MLHDHSPVQSLIGREAMRSAGRQRRHGYRLFGG